MHEDRKRQITESFARSGMMQLFGAEISNITKGHVEITVSKKSFMARPAGMFNGSTIATLVDVSSGYAAVSARDQDCYFTTVELKVNYLNPAVGDQLVAKADVIKSGRQLTVVRADIFALQGGTETLAATSLVTMMQLSGKTRTAG